MKRDLNEILKLRETQEAKSEQKNELKHLDDATRVKIISPGRLVAKRFVRNRLAIVGTVILIFMFVFSFICPLFYSWGQTERDYKYDSMNTNYALAKENREYLSYTIDDAQINNSVLLNMNSNINAMAKNGQSSLAIFADDEYFLLEPLAERIYVLSQFDGTEVAVFGDYTTQVATYYLIGSSVRYADGVEPLDVDFESAVKELAGQGTFDLNGVTYEMRSGTEPKTFDVFALVSGAFSYPGEALGDAFENAAKAAAEAGNASFSVGGADYALVVDGSAYRAVECSNSRRVAVSTMYYNVMQEAGASYSDDFRVKSLLAVADGGSFEADGTTYTVDTTGETPVFYREDGSLYAELSTFVIRRYDGTDTMNYDLKVAITDAIEAMEAEGSSKTTLQYQLPKQSEEDSSYELDENGNYIYEDAELTITRKDTQEYQITANMSQYMFNSYAKPSSKHILGTDGDGYDVLARMMYGGRISLMVGFVVVILETILGVIMGGLAGYFGGVVDNIIMRMVDIFYCLPSMPIMIILGAMMDAQRFSTYARLLVMMAVLGILGWAGIARLVRGQILSLREQDFMTATEATGVRVNRRIFRHLVPNVMPQLIVTATSGLGGVILTESTLSFLGLGVKPPLATWGTMINSVSSQAALENYYYIWIPVGMLICLTVIAFNFVGDGLRDAYDPKSKE